MVYQRSLPLATEQLRIVPSTAGERAGVLGAAALAIGHVLSPEAIEEASTALTARRGDRRLRLSRGRGSARAPP